MKTQSRQRVRRFQLQILGYGNCYYIERIAELEAALAKKPRWLRIEMVGVGEILADAALRIRSILMGRSPKTRIITDALSSLHGGSVLVWLLGDSRIIRDDAKLFFRRANVPDDTEAEPDVWKDKESSFWDSSADFDPEEGDYARVLQLIDEFLPVKEMAGRLIAMPELRQFGLIENEKVDQFLSVALGRERSPRRSPVRRKQLPCEQDCNDNSKANPETALDFMI